VASSLTGIVNGPYWATLLSQKLGYPVQGEPYYTSGCVSSSQCVFPNAQLPVSAWATPAQKLLQYIPAANNAEEFKSKFPDSAPRLSNFRKSEH